MKPNRDLANLTFEVFLSRILLPSIYVIHAGTRVELYLNVNKD